MKKSIIREVLNELDEQMLATKITDSMCRNNVRVDEAFEEVSAKLSGERLEVHQRFVDVLEKALDEEKDFYFVKGFKLGLRIGIESMEE